MNLSSRGRADLDRYARAVMAGYTRIMPMSGRPFLWTRQKAGGLSGWRICSGSTRLMDAHPILNGSLKDIDVYDCEASELDAIARNAGLGRSSRHRCGS